MSAYALRTAAATEGLFLLMNGSCLAGPQASSPGVCYNSGTWLGAWRIEGSFLVAKPFNYGAQEVASTSNTPERALVRKGERSFFVLVRELLSNARPRNCSRK